MIYSLRCDPHVQALCRFVLGYHVDGVFVSPAQLLEENNSQNLGKEIDY